MEFEPTAPPRDRTWAFYIVLFSIIVIVAIAFGMMNAAEEPDAKRPSISSADLMNGDLQARIALSGPHFSSDPEPHALAAIAAYSNGLPSPVAYRRIGIVKQVLLGQPGLSDLVRVGGREAAMWCRIYSDKPLSRREAVKDVKFVRKLSLGPLEEAAVAEVYAHAGMLDRANSALAAARAGAHRVVVALLALFFGMMLMGLAGAFMLSCFFLRGDRDVGTWSGLGYHVLFPAFVAYLFSAVAFSAVVAFGSEGSSAELFLALLANVGAFLVGMWVLRERSAQAGVDYRDIGLRLRGFWVPLKQGIVGYCAALPVMAVTLGIAVALQQTVFSNFPTSEHPIVPLTHGGGSALLLAFVLAVVVAPVIEETFFRGALYGGLRNRMGMWGAAAFSGLLFASVHPTLPTGFLPIMALGMVLAVLREKTGSLYPCMVCHALNNAIMLTAAVLLY